MEEGGGREGERERKRGVGDGGGQGRRGTWEGVKNMSCKKKLVLSKISLYLSSNTAALHQNSLS